MFDPLKLGIVGVGRMGAFHARHLGALAGIELVAVMDTRREVADQLAAEAGARPYTSTSELLERSDVEAWLVATPSASHPQVVGEGLGAGLHVLCEKPLSLDPVDSQLLGASALDRGRILQVGFWRRFSPPWVKAKQLIDAGAIGQPLMLRLAQWDAFAPPATFCDPAVSGGLAVDCGVHEFDLAEWLTDQRIARVTARNLPVVDQEVGRTGDVDNLVALLDYANGGAATVELSRNARYGDDVRTEILGSEGAIFVDQLPKGRTRLATSAGIEVVAGSEVTDAMAAGVVAQAQAFAAAIRGETVAVPGAEASSRAVSLARAVQEAAVTGQTIAV